MSIFTYLIEANLYLVSFYVCYLIFLRRETHFSLSRWYLNLSIAFSLAIPFLKLDFFKSDLVYNMTGNAVDYLYIIQSSGSDNEGLLNLERIRFSDLLLTVYLIGFAFCVVRLIYSFFRVYGMLSMAEIEEKENFKTARVEGLKEVFAFGPYIFFGKTDNRLIIEHEKAHVLQKHYLDIFLMELLIAVFWYNPVVYGMRKSLRNTHEYLADSHVSSKEDMVEYAELMVSSAFDMPGNTQFKHAFYSSNNLKTRLVMLMKKRSSKLAALKYGVVLPLGLCLVFISSSAFVVKQNIEEFSEVIADKVDKPLGQIVESIKVKESVPASTKRTLTVEKASSTKDSIKVKSMLLAVKKDAVVDPSVADKLPEYPEGLSVFYGKISAVTIPETLKKQHINGKMFFSFIVEKDGSLSNIKVVRSLHPQLDVIFSEFLKSSQKWHPGTLKGHPVRVQYSLPIVIGTPSQLQADRNANGLATSLMIVDGKEVTQEDFKKLNPVDIESVNVFKGDKALALYGEKGKNGVIAISTKLASKSDVRNPDQKVIGTKEKE